MHTRSDLGLAHQRATAAHVHALRGRVSVSLGHAVSPVSYNTTHDGGDAASALLHGRRWIAACFALGADRALEEAVSCPLPPAGDAVHPHSSQQAMGWRMGACMKLTRCLRASVGHFRTPFSLVHSELSPVHSQIERTKSRRHTHPCCTTWNLLG